jgi:hypothetical protein
MQYVVGLTHLEEFKVNLGIYPAIFPEDFFTESGKLA